MILVLVGTLLLFAPGAWALHRARTEIAAAEHISRTTFLAAYAAFTGHCLVTILAAALHAWPISDPPFSLLMGVMIGSPIFFAGAVVNIAGRRQFHSFRLMWGLSNDRLVTGGIYAWTRNPQTVGWLLMYIGMGMLGRSYAALALGAVFFVALVIWIPMEEQVLERRFGGLYANYRRAVPRFFRLTPRRPDASVVEPKSWNAEKPEAAEEARAEPSEAAL